MALRPRAVTGPSAAQVERWDKQFVWHPFTQHYLWENEPTILVESGRGATFTDLRGKRYLDGVSSLWVNLHGHRHPRLDAALKRQIGKIAHSSFLGLSHKPAVLLARELASLAPRGLTRTFFSDNGATAVEVALKMAFQYWIETTGKARPAFLALRGSYHGDTLGAVSVGSIGAFHSKFGPLLAKNEFAMAPACFRCPFNRTGLRHRSRAGESVKVVPKPGDARAETACRWECLGDARKVLRRSKGRVAAAIVEPVMQAATGMNAMPPGYVAGLAKICREENVLLIADEVATGFTRTGTLFACEQEGVQPDFLCLAKALTGGTTPLAATMTTETVFRAFRAPVKEGRTFFHGHSYTAHPMGSAVALENLKVIRDEKTVVVARRKSILLRNELRRLADHPHVGSIRQAGLMVGVELVADRNGDVRFPAARRAGAAVCRRLLTDGIWLRPLGDTVVIFPPAVISDGDLRQVVRALEAAINHEFPAA